MLFGEEKTNQTFTVDEIKFSILFAWLPFPAVALADVLLVVAGVYDPVRHDQIHGIDLLLYWCRITYLLVIAMIASLQLIYTAQTNPDMRSNCLVYRAVKLSWAFQIVALAVFKCFAYLMT